MPPRRILILTNRVPYPLSDGGNLAMKAMIDGYRDAGWDVCLLSMNTSRHYVEARTVRSVYPGVRVELVDINNDVRPLATILNFLFSSLPNHAARFDKQAFRVKLIGLLSEFKPDIVQLESVFLSGYLGEIRKTKALAVLRMHNVEWQVWERVASENASPIKSVYLRNLARRIRSYEQRVWRKFDLLLAITEVDAAIAKAFNPQVLPVPFGIDVAKVRPGVELGNRSCYHIGAMDWLPNVEAMNWFLAEVWPLIHQKHPALDFHYAGRNMPESFRSRQTPGAFCAGEVPDSEKFIADKNILVVPLRSGGGIRVKILEAMAAGKLVISTAVGMQGIDAIAGQHYLQANTPGEFVAAMDTVFADPARARQLAANGQALAARNYDRKGIMQRLVIAVDNMLKNKTM